MMTFNIGDTVWYAASEPRRVTIRCPVCFGKREVVVILGDDSRVAVDCDYCGKGYEGPQGSTIEYDSTPIAISDIVTGMELTATAQGTSVAHYDLGKRSHVYPDKVHADEATALAAAVEARREYMEGEDRRLGWKKETAPKDATWSVGYHMREAKKCSEKLKYHEGKARVKR